MNLASAPWYNGIYPLIHKILAVEGRVPPAGEIRLLTLGDFEAPPPSTVLELAAGAEYFEEHGKILVRVLELIAQAK